DRPVEPEARRWVPLAGWALFAVAAALLAVIASRRSHPAPEAAPVRVSIELDSTPHLRPSAPAPLLSSDGRPVLVPAGRDNRRQAFLRDLARNEVVPVPGTEDGYHPFLSPDGNWIAFASDGKLRKVRAEGGSPVALGPSYWGGGSWG